MEKGKCFGRDGSKEGRLISTSDGKGGNQELTWAGSLLPEVGFPYRDRRGIPTRYPKDCEISFDTLQVFTCLQE